MVRWVVGSILHGEHIELFLVPACGGIYLYLTTHSTHFICGYITLDIIMVKDHTIWAICHVRQVYHIPQPLLH